MAFGLRVPFFGTGIGSGLWLALIGMFLRGAARQHQAGSDVAGALEGVPVASLMRADAVSVPGNASIRALVDRWFSHREEGAYPVFFGERFIGIINVDDLAKVPVEAWEDHTAREIMRAAASIPVIAPSDLVFDALRKMGTTGLRGLPVMDDGALVGMLFERDVARWVTLKKSSFAPAGKNRPDYA
jgi:CBS domain-containing protein